MHQAALTHITLSITNSKHDQLSISPHKATYSVLTYMQMQHTCRFNVINIQNATFNTRSISQTEKKDHGGCIKPNIIAIRHINTHFAPTLSRSSHGLLVAWLVCSVSPVKPPQWRLLPLRLQTSERRPGSAGPCQCSTFRQSLLRVENEFFHTSS